MLVHHATYHGHEAKEDTETMIAHRLLHTLQKRLQHQSDALSLRRKREDARKASELASSKPRM